MVSPRVRRARQETALGFVGFFLVVALAAAVANALSEEPSVVPALVALVMLVVFGVTWRAWRRG